MVAGGRLTAPHSDAPPRFEVPPLAVEPTGAGAAAGAAGRAGSFMTRARIAKKAGALLDLKGLVRKSAI